MELMQKAPARKKRSGFGAFCLKHKKLHIWLAAAAASLFLFYILRLSRAAANFITEYVTGPLKRGLAAACSLAPFSVAELCIALFVTALLLMLAHRIWKIIRYPNRGAAIYRTLCGLLCIALTVYSGLGWLHGIDYYADSFQDKSGIYAAGASEETLYELTAYFAAKASELGETTERDEDGLFSYELRELIEQSLTAYGNLEGEFGFLALHDFSIKQIVLSEFMSYVDTTGFYFPFTGESNLNTDAPMCMIPATILHEMAHQRGVASENEANFVAILACVTSGNSAFAYSGYLFGYIHLSNALYGENPSLWLEARSLLSDACIADLAYNNAYWARYDTAISDASSDIYDSFLKSFGEDSGIKSYGEVVDLLIAYFSGAL